jgi:hypothetical protein
MRIIAVLMLIAPIVAATVAFPVRVSEACSPSLSDLTSIARSAAFIGVVEVSEPGAAENPFPPVPPLPTFTPEPTATFETPPPTLKPFEKTPTPYPVEPHPTPTPFDMTGIGARVRIVTSYVGQQSGELDLDSATRERVARLAREAESFPPGVISSCPVNLGVNQFLSGQQHLVLADQQGTVLFGPRLAGPPDALYMDGEYLYLLPRSIAERHFPDVDFSDAYTITDDVAVHEDKVPVSKIIAIIAELRGDNTIILPPNTGTAGLKGAGSR